MTIAVATATSSCGQSHVRDGDALIRVRSVTLYVLWNAADGMAMMMHYCRQSASPIALQYMHDM
jgi:hypothetical protein